LSFSNKKNRTSLAAQVKKCKNVMFLHFLFIFSLETSFLPKWLFFIIGIFNIMITELGILKGKKLYIVNKFSHFPDNMLYQSIRILK
jgi:hypothetical protein